MLSVSSVRAMNLSPSPALRSARDMASIDSGSSIFMFLPRCDCSEPMAHRIQARRGAELCWWSYTTRPAWRRSPARTHSSPSRRMPCDRLRLSAPQDRLRVGLAVAGQVCGHHPLGCGVDEVTGRHDA